MSREILLQWRSWPAVERPWTTVILVVFLLFVAALVWNITVNIWQTPFYYFLGMLLVLGNLLPWFIPTDYELDHQGVHVRYLFIKVSRKWEDFGCFYQDKRGVMLSTFKMPRRLDPFRGQSLRFSAKKTEEEELIKILMDKIGKKY